MGFILKCSINNPNVCGAKLVVSGNFLDTEAQPKL